MQVNDNAVDEVNNLRGINQEAIWKNLHLKESLLQ